MLKKKIKIDLKTLIYIKLKQKYNFGCILTYICSTGDKVVSFQFNCKNNPKMQT
jgi:hypothetical protein